MTRSMTAYCQETMITKKFRLTIEIQSVNGRYLDIHFRLPDVLKCFEISMQKWISEVINRGKVLVKMSIDWQDESPFLIKPNLSLAKELKKACSSLAKELNVDLSDVLKHTLLKDNSLLHYQTRFNIGVSFEAPLKKALNQALKSFIAMKETEGKVLVKQIDHSLQKILSSHQFIKKHQKDQVASYRMKLLSRIEDVIGKKEINDDRILKEIALFAEKIDISEEITRLESHLSQFKMKLKSKGKIGKTLDFILQEMNREVNTIGSKSEDIRINQQVIEMKSEIEKIREQVQNIE